MKTKYIFYLFAITFLFSGCADTEIIKGCVTGESVGFWHGLWHGMIAPFSLIGHLFDQSIAVYQVNNSGGWYDFGFLLGVGALTTGKNELK